MVICAWLKAHSRPDQEYPINTISSIYYDTTDWRHLREKVNGDFIKSKLRLRWYTSNDASVGNKRGSAYAELKSKVGAKREKQRVKVDLSIDWLEDAPLNSAELLSLPSNLLSSGFKVPSRLLPTLLITYRRRRFIDFRSNTRINIDDQIRVKRVNPQVIQIGQLTSINTPVVEFKGTSDQLPHGFEPLLRFGIRRASFSKYLICYRCISGTLNF